MIAHHNRVLAAARKRADELEPRVAGLVQPVLERAADTAARDFTRNVTDHMTATAGRRADWRAINRLGLAPADARERLRELGASLALTAAAPGVTSASTMIALYPRPEEAATIAAIAGGSEPAEILHVTLGYLGDTEGLPSDLVSALCQVANNHAPLVGTVGGLGRFADGGDGAPMIALPDVPGLIEVRQAVAAAATNAGVSPSSKHGYTAHLTLHYAGAEGWDAPVDDLLGLPLHFDAIYLVRADEVLAEIPLCGPVPVALTSAGDGKPDWSIPAANEVLDVDAVVAQLRTKTDPVRLALIENVMGSALEAHGIDWDMANPFAARVLAQSGSQIVDIAATTQLNAMRVIRASWEQGLTIPDTAKAIRSGMREASVARSVLIARTELTGAANGGSLAATQIVAAETGVRWLKEWLTGEGAIYPRHEEYEGLDGQTAELDEPFDVGGEALMFPGDPDGPPEEVCNCRCALAYVEAETDTSGAAPGVEPPDLPVVDDVG